MSLRRYVRMMEKVREWVFKEDEYMFQIYFIESSGHWNRIFFWKSDLISHEIFLGLIHLR